MTIPFFKPIPFRLLLISGVLFLFRITALMAQDRDGSIDLTGGEGRSIYVNHDGSGSGIGVEGKAFTVEAWVRLSSNDNNNFNFFRFRNGDARVSVDYRGDDNKSDEPWRVQITGGSDGEGTWNMNYNKNGSTGPDFLNKWHHVAFTTNGGSTVQLYIDGTLLLQWTLQDKNGNSVALYPSNGDGDGNSFIGDESVVTGAEGTFYVGEVRIWKTRLSASEISTYYDEEINSSHPEWSNLVRYYHGNEFFTSGTTRYYYDRSPSNLYNAYGNNDDIGLSLTYTPTVKPPSFDNTDVNPSFSASTCNTDDGIDLSWTDFQASSTYKSGTTPSYEVTRVSDNATIYTGGAGSKEDTDVSAGDAETYQLKTRWYINDVAVYSDDKLTSNKGSMTKVYAAPSSVSATTDKCDGTINITWSHSSGDPQYWKLQRSTTSGFTSGNATLSSTISGSDRSYTNTSPNIETDYYYRVIANGTDDNGCSVTATWSSAAMGVTSEPPSAPTNLTVVVDDVNNELDITWTDPSNSYASGFILRREKLDGTNAVDIALASTVTSYSDTDISICETYRYKIAATNACSPNGVFSNTTQTGLLGLDIDDVLTSVNASKGYFSNEVLIEWEIKGSLSQVDRFRIERTVAGQDKYQLIGVVDNNLFFSDESASSGVFYNYRITGETTCNDLIVYTNEIVDLGFRQPFGIANGHVEYSGGNAVKDVVINFERTDGAQIGNSLKFDGDGDYVAIDSFYYKGSDYAEMTVETWFRTTNSDDQIIAAFDASDYWRMEINGSSADAGKVGMVISNNSTQKKMQSTITVDDGEWHHVAIVFDNGTLTMYLDGEFNVSSEIGISTFGSATKRYGFLGIGSEADGFNGTTGPNYYFDGNLDEFRLWSVARTEDQIKNNYDRLISNEQVGLEIYYRFDEGVGSEVYDVAKTGENFNQNDGLFVGGTSFSGEIPSSNKLGIRATTDKYGDYTADYIPYNGSGDVFRVTPAYGQHQFTPSSKSIYLGDGSFVQNNVDFEDISFFTIKGSVTYYNSEVPVEGVAIYIDGVQALGADNKVVRTNSEGNYEINVPIGNHYLSTYKEGHIFSYGVFPPLDEYGGITYHNFIEDLPVNFVDSTKVTVAGRIVGGKVQGQYKLGFDQSLNNIGVADLGFQLQKEGYDLDVTSDIFRDLSVTTDAYSGEYSISLIPEKWVITKAGNNAYEKAASDIPVLDLSSSLDKIYSIDTTYAVDNTIEAIDTFTYHHDLQFIIRSTPSLVLYGADGASFHGEDSLTFISQSTGEDTTVYLVDQNPFPFDFYEMGVDYEANIYVYEIYQNPDHPDYLPDGLIDRVPVKDVEITINDNIMINPEATSGKTDADGHLQYLFRAGVPNLSKDDENSYTKTFEVNGEVDGIGITWREGDTYRAYILGASPLDGTNFVTYGPDMVDIVLRDPPGSNSYAYLEQGSSFDAAETWQFNQFTSQGLDAKIYNGFLAQAGGGLAGPVVKNETIYTSTIGATIERYIDYDGRYGRKVTFNERIETSSDPEDVGSMADLYIGRSFNAFIQETKNLKIMTKAYCESHGIDTYGSGELVLGVINGFTMDAGDTETYFIYSQRHILEELIPQLYILRNSLLVNNDKYVSNLSYDHPCYGFSNNAKALFDYFDVGQIHAGNVSYTFTPEGAEIDSVDYLNDQITTWLNHIADNEAEKASAITQTNLSIDGSTGAYSSEISEEFSGTYNWNSSRKIKMKWDGEFTNIFNNNGLGILSTMDIDLNFGRGEEHSQSKKMTFGYVIDERDEGDYYSIDVKKQEGIALFDESDFVDNLPSKQQFIDDQLTRTGIAAGAAAGILYFNATAIGNGIGNLLGQTTNANALLATLKFGVNLALWTYEMVDLGQNATAIIDKANGALDTKISGFSISSPVFSVRGGQSRCPYEAAEYASFYIDDSNNLPLLHTATLQREVPVINSEPSIRENVPMDETASFTLTLGNESESGTDVWYELSIDESSNPDGATLLVDGVSAERAFLVPAWGAVKKTLTLQAGSTGVMDYDNIAVVLHSMCQADPATSQDVLADTVFISAHFLPICSSVEITNMNDNWVINYDDNDKANITLGGYDVNVSTLESISFQYKSLSGNPTTVMAYFKDETSDAYAEYTGPKGVLSGAESSFAWDIADLTDRQYQIRAKATCTDGSVTESDYLTGVIDRSTPVAFGIPEPADGIYQAGDDISIRFSEVLEADLVKDHNISVRAVLNGANVSHATSVQFDGANDDMSIDNISFTGKSFTIEFWSQFAEESVSGETTWFEHSSGSNLVKASRSGTNILFTLGQTSATADPTSYYNAVTPWDSWHHWAFVYDNDNNKMALYMDDKLVMEKYSVDFNPAYQGIFNVAASEFAGKMHELRIWEDVRSYGELVSNMSVTLTGSEPGLYGYWPMDEGTGTRVFDKTSQRQGEVMADWTLEPGGYSWQLDGTNYLTMSAINMIAYDETDFTLEFWANGEASATSTTLFSNGLVDTEDNDPYIDPESVLNIYADDRGLIHVLSGAYDFQATDKDFMDGNWHHMALVVDRSATAKFYVDGNLQKSTDVSNMASIFGPEFVIGARVNHLGTVTSTYDQYFNGHVDEIRFWTSARSKLLLQTYMNTKLVGDEPGLVAYLPFETYELNGAYIMTESLSDLALDEDLSVAPDAVSSDASDHYSDFKPAVRDVRGTQELDVQYVVNGDEIIITPSTDANRLEGQLLEITVSNVYDLNGNRQLSPITWTTYAQQNQVTWDGDYLELTKDVEVDLSITASFTNRSGTAYAYELENIPSWLKTAQPSGVVSPQQTVKITFEVSEALNIGSYDVGINLTTELDFDEKLNINLRVFGDEPDWIVDDKNFEYSMSIFGRLSIDGVISTDEYDKVGVFVGDELRGVASPTYVAGVDEYQVFLNIYSNNVSSEPIELKIYDASSGNIHENVTPEVFFVANSILGTVVSPINLEADDRISKIYDLRAGWTWISFNLEDENLAEASALFGDFGTEGDIVKNQSSFDEYNGGLWFGTLTNSGGFKAGDMYKVKLAESATLKVIGIPFNVDNNPIAVGTGWNHIGFVPQEKMTLTEALVSFNSEVGDIIKSSSAFAMYSGSSLGWVGSLNKMVPGVGYMIYATSEGVLTYPERASLSGSRLMEEKSYDDYFVVEENQEGHTMSIVAAVKGFDFSTTTDEYLLVAYSNDEVIGYAPAISVADQTLFFLSAAAESEDLLHFKIYDITEKAYHELNGAITYGINRVVGTVFEPVLLEGYEVLGNSDVDHISVYPNPFETYVDIRINSQESKIDISLFDLTGKIIFTKQVDNTSSTDPVIRLKDELLGLPKGFYQLVILEGAEKSVFKLVK